MQRWLRRIKRAVKYVKTYYRNTVREFDQAIELIRQLDQPPVPKKAPARRATSTRKPRRRQLTIVVKVEPYTRSDGISVKRHTRHIKKDQNNAL